MKGLRESLITERQLLRFSSNDKKNLDLIASEIEEITAAISSYFDATGEDMFESDSVLAEVAPKLSNLASMMRGDWPDDIVFSASDFK